MKGQKKKKREDKQIILEEKFINFYIFKVNFKTFGKRGTNERRRSAPAL